MQESNNPSSVNLQNKLFQRIHHPWLDQPLDLDLPSLEALVPPSKLLLTRDQFDESNPLKSDFESAKTQHSWVNIPPSLLASVTTLHTHLSSALYAHYESQFENAHRLFALETSVDRLVSQLTQSNHDCRKALVAIMSQIQERLRGIEVRADVRAKEVDLTIERAQRNTDNLVNEIMRTAQDCKIEVTQIDAKVDKMFAEVTKMTAEIDNHIEVLKTKMVTRFNDSD